MYTIEDFIGVFPNALDSNFCNDLIKHFEYVKEHTSFIRPRPNDPLKISDNSLIFNDFAWTNDTLIGLHDQFNKAFFDATRVCLELYKEKYSILTRPERSGIFDSKVQRTLPGEGFHEWHAEAMTRFTSPRYLTYQLYLNTIDEGGETEFIYQKRRFKPIQGTLLIWPAAFTHTHRGNQPLSGPKYIVTTWEEFF
tara:strand:- start:2651 stop:3235 length:585 start_codon:yes stop_codon:yes gene_type:complete